MVPIVHIIMVHILKSFKQNALPGPFHNSSDALLLYLEILRLNLITLHWHRVLESKKHTRQKSCLRAFNLNHFHVISGTGMLVMVPNFIMVKFHLENISILIEKLTEDLMLIRFDKTVWL